MAAGFGVNDLAGNVATTASGFPITWTVDLQNPTVTIALQAGSDTGLSSSDGITSAGGVSPPSLVFNVTFSESVTGFDASDLSTTGSATGCSVPVIGGGPAAYTTTFTGCSEGTLTVSVAANAVSDAATNLGPVALASSGTVRIDRTGPTVTVEQAASQVDPAHISPVNFTVTFDDNVADFVTGDVTLGGTAGATTQVVTGSAKVYNVAVSGMTLIGTVTAALAAGVATDAAGNLSLVSTSTDNSVTWDNSTASISGYVFNDVSVTGDVLGAAGLNGVTVCVDSNNDGSCASETHTAVTSGTGFGAGSWTLGSLPAGTYKVRYTIPTGWINTGTGADPDPSLSNCGAAPLTIAVTPGQAVGQGPFFYGYKLCTVEADASVSGSVYDDPDGSGTFSAGDSKYIDTAHPVTIFSDTNNDGLLNVGEPRTTADTHGNYTLGGLIAATHHLVIAPPTGWNSTDINVPLDQPLTAGQSVTKVDFFMAIHFISGRVVNNRGNSIVRRDFQKRRIELLALVNVHGLDRVRQPGLLEEDRQLVAIRRRPVVEVDHQNVPGNAPPSTSTF